MIWPISVRTTASFCLLYAIWFWYLTILALLFAFLLCKRIAPGPLDWLPYPAAVEVPLFEEVNRLNVCFPYGYSGMLEFPSYTFPLVWTVEVIHAGSFVAKLVWVGGERPRILCLLSFIKLLPFTEEESCENSLPEFLVPLTSTLLFDD